MIKLHQNALSKKMADNFQCFSIELNRTDMIFVNYMDKTNSCQMYCFTDVME